MTFIYRRAVEIDSTNTWKYLPPFGPLDVSIEPDVIVDIEDVPYYADGAAGFVETYARAHGTRIKLSGNISADNAPDGEAVLEDMRTWFWSDGRPVTVHFCDFLDSTDTLKGVWQYCRATGPMRIERGGRTGRAKWSVELRTPYTEPQLAAPDATQPANSSAYEQYYYNSSWTPATPGTTGRPEVVVQVSNTPYKVIFTFPGILSEATNADNVESRQIEFTPHPTKAMKITSLQPVGGDAPTGASGNTVIVCGDSDYTSPPPAGNYLSKTLAYSTNKATAATGTVTIALNTKLYLFVTSAAGHQNLQIAVGLEPA